MQRDTIKILLVGNPNSGKSSVFNHLTGLNQRVGNFPGVTVEKKTGTVRLSPTLALEITDLPGLYSMYATTLDEKIASNYILEVANTGEVDIVLYVADSTKLDTHLMLFTQLKDLGLPMILLLNMEDEAKSQGVSIDLQKLEQFCEVPCVFFNGRTGGGRSELLRLLKTGHWGLKSQGIVSLPDYLRDMYTHWAKEANGLPKDYWHWVAALTNHGVEIESNESLSKETRLRLQIEETVFRLNNIQKILKNGYLKSAHQLKTKSKIDRFLAHPWYGTIFFLLIMLFVFQAVFAWAEVPMNWIEVGFASLALQIKAVLPETWFTDMLADGVLSGIGGIVVFVPQIAILFFFLTILEESGYMARIVYLFDQWMRRFGLNGRSIVTLIAGGACAIPAIMSARTIANWKERLITIFVTPLISCSARIPIYTVLVGLVVPSGAKLGWFNIQGLVFLSLYVGGIMAALLVAWIMSKMIKSEEASFLALELPSYKWPLFKNILLNVKERVHAFVWEAGKIIMVISMILWAAASYGPAQSREEAKISASEMIQQQGLQDEEAEALEAALLLESSYAGQFGKWIEPAIAPLGFDWKIGIALLTSFAAREVFVGTIATIYSVHNEDERSIRKQMAEATDPRTGKKIYDTPTVISLLIFYLLAMQCMSTLAIVKRETHSIKWPILQFLAYTLAAYLFALAAYQILA